jgi:hypothetical protein
MGNSNFWQNSWINPKQKMEHGLIRDGAGFVTIDQPGEFGRSYTLVDTATQNRDELQALRILDTSNGGTKEYWVEYSAQNKGVFIQRIPRADDPSTREVTGWPSILLRSSDGPLNSSLRQYFIPGESRVLESGQVRVQVISADAKEAWVMVDRPADPPGLAVVPSALTLPDSAYGDGWVSAYAALHSTCSSYTYTQNAFVGINAGTMWHLYGARSVNVTAYPNKTSKPLNTTFTVSGCGSSGTLVVTQSARAQLSLKASTLRPVASGGLVSTSVTTNQRIWSASVTKGSDWLIVYGRSGGLTGESLTIMAQPNNGGSRSGTVTVTSGSATKTLKITQAAASIKVSPSSWSPKAYVETKTFTVATNLAAVWARSDSPYLTVSGPDAAGRFTARVAANEQSAVRNASIIITGEGGYYQRVGVKQAAGVFKTSLSRWSAPRDGGTQMVTVTTSAPTWTVEVRASDNWIHYTSGYGGDPSSLVLWVSGNTGAKRSGVVTVKSGYMPDKVITITQEAVRR